MLLVFAAARRYSRALEERGNQDFRRGVLILGFFAAVLLILIGIGMAIGTVPLPRLLRSL
jgi:hypothetical protein